MAHFVGLDVSVKETSVCVVDDAGKVILEQKVLTEPADIIAVLTSLGVTYGRIGIEAGPLSQWLVNALTAAELPVICVGDAAHEGFTDGAANQQDGPQ
jgi:transposase